MRILKSFFLILSLLFIASESLAQEGVLSGTVRDALSGETLPSAFVLWANKENGVAVDPSGKFSVSLPFGEYEFIITAVGYEEVKKKISITKREYSIDFDLIQTTQKELVITSDFAVGRSVPVAFSNIGLKRIEEELSGRELATLANTTPGAYATRSGGGDGDARVTIRGFSGNNVAVMLDGVPVNDMENGTVYWSNWFGLDLATQTTQIQRGLGASKLVIPAVGGTMNIMTRGIDSKRRAQVREEYSYGAFARTSFSYNSGKTKNGWAYSLAGSYKKGDGWIEGGFTKGYFFYGKVEKVLGNHLLSLYAVGAPQSHGQRTKTDAVAMYDNATALALNSGTQFQYSGASRDIYNGGINYNPDVGYLTRYDFANGVKTNEQAQETVNGKVNFFFKPQFSFKDIWTINEKSFLSTVAYMSMGHGGGTGWRSGLTVNDYNANGSVNVQSFFDSNVGNKIPLFSGPDYNINNQVSSTERYAVSNYLKASMNDHMWYGALSTYSNKINDNLTFSGGIDVRQYKGSHYAKIIDLMGADYAWVRDKFNYNSTNLIKRVGDTVDYHNDAFIRWGGLFGQMEFEKNKISAFFSASAAETGYMRVDYFKPKVYTVDGVDVPVGYGYANNAIAMQVDTTIYNGQTLYSNMPGSKYQSTGWYYRSTFTVKSGVKYSFNKNVAAFVNGGYLNKAPLFNQVYTNSNQRFNQIFNEKITSFETGLNFKSKKFSTNFNAYFTDWKNKPYPGGISVPNPQDPTTLLTLNIQGMNARHMGAEMDFAYKINDRLTFEGLVSVGDWRWMSDTKIYVTDNANNIVYNNPSDPSSGQMIVEFNAKNVHVSDAAQTQVGGMLRYEWKSGAYVKTRYTYFDRYFAQANPFTLHGENSHRDSWRIPAYGTLEFHAGYSCTIQEKVKIDLRGSMFNVLNSHYITDATNNDPYALYTNTSATFGANSAGVFFAQGRWFSLSLTATY
ncbi:MAG: carboxypeptidase-like regulatory domain-containing protein [Sediminibacterium sp.]